MPTPILFDFFGTLVDYSPTLRITEYPRTVAALDKLGMPLTPESFHTRWSAAWRSNEELFVPDHREFSMLEVASTFAAGELDQAQIATLIEVYIAEWNDGVQHIDGLADWIRELSRGYRLAIVSNTHEPALVPDHLHRMGIAGCFDLVVLSVELGLRKPHPSIYASALDGLGIAPQSAVFVGDSHQADFVGPQAAGIRSYLIDPHDIAGVPADQRLGTVFDLSDRLRRRSG